MSEKIQNDREKQDKLKSIIRDLHEGKSADEVKKDFGRLIRNVSPQEISDMEQKLLDEGFPPEEIQRLCEVHVDVFKQSLDKEKKPHKLPGHPIHTFMEENKAAGGKIKILKPLARKLSRGVVSSEEQAQEALRALEPVLVHYTRKENQLFPYLEKHGFTGPSKVMWGKHDEIRLLFKKIKETLKASKPSDAAASLSELAGKIKKMIFMEEKILFPNALKRLSDSEWAEIRRGEGEIGYAWIKPGNLWDANIAGGVSSVPEEASGSRSKPRTAGTGGEAGLPLKTGNLTPEQINLMLTCLPLDISFVDENDKVLYYSDTLERLFPRSPAVIGREVRNCHPPKSVQIVEKIIESFRKKEKDKAEFWISMNGRFVHIRYFPMYDDAGNYKGVLEVSQDVTDIRSLEGERRLLDW